MGKGKQANGNDPGGAGALYHHHFVYPCSLHTHMHSSLQAEDSRGGGKLVGAAAEKKIVLKESTRPPRRDTPVSPVSFAGGGGGGGASKRENTYHQRERVELSRSP